jgi:uncharacterized RDD family membrane protein YckC
MTNPYAPPSATVYDVADRSASLVPAGRGTRLGAQILDGVVVGVMVYIPFLIGAGLSAPTNDFEPATVTPLALGAFLVGVAGFIAWAYFTIVFVSRNGQTIAKKWLDIKVVRSDGSPASLGRIFWLRNVVNGLLSIIPLYAIIDSLFIFSESRQCLHDKLADTIVVNA